MVVPASETVTICCLETSPPLRMASDRLAHAQTDPAALVTGHHQRAKTETPAALDDFGVAIDEDDLLGQLMNGLAVARKLGRLARGFIATRTTGGAATGATARAATRATAASTAEI